MTTSRTALAAVVLSLAMSLDGAGAAEPTTTPVRVVPRVLNGTPTSAFPEVALLWVRRDTGTIRCSGTLIEPTVVLTAAHCLLDARGALAVFVPGDGSTVEVPTVAGRIHPEYHGGPFADVGLVFLSAPPPGIAPASLPTRRLRSRRGNIVGFGHDGEDTTILKRTGTLHLKARCGRYAAGSAFPRRDLAASLCWQAKPGGNDGCSGDSGAPIFVKGRVAGVHSGKFTATPDQCAGTLSMAASVVRFRDWIDGEIAAGAAGPQSASR